MDTVPNEVSPENGTLLNSKALDIIRTYGRVGYIPYQGITHEYFDFISPTMRGIRSDTNGLEILHAVARDPNRVLTPDEEKLALSRANQGIKIHIQATPADRLRILDALLNNISQSSFKGLGRRIWKMKTFTHPKQLEFPDFVFYSDTDITAWDDARNIIHELLPILQPLELSMRPAPRFNTPVLIDGAEQPGIFIARGEGDLKTYFQRHKPQSLGEYYDPDRNFAVLKEDSSEFA